MAVQECFCLLCRSTVLRKYHKVIHVKDDEIHITALDAIAYADVLLRLGQPELIKHMVQLFVPDAIGLLQSVQHFVETTHQR